MINFVQQQLKSIDSGIICSEDVLQQKVISEARENYQALYQEERELNETFSQFVHNYKAAYEGMNTRKEQIIDSEIQRKDVTNTDQRECIY